MKLQPERRKLPVNNKVQRFFIKVGLLKQPFRWYPSKGYALTKNMIGQVIQMPKEWLKHNSYEGESDLWANNIRTKEPKQASKK